MEKLSSHLNHVSTATILGHVRPDGDCVGSCLATWNYLHTWYPDIRADVYLEPIPNIFRFLSGADRIISDFGRDFAYDLCIVQDCGDEGRLGGAAKYFRTAKRTICIDHHISNGSFAEVNYVDPVISSTSELVYDMMEEERVTKEIAECIYVGLVHDTGVFQYNSTTAKTMNIAGKLMEKGIDFTKIVDDTFYKKSHNQNRILGHVLEQSRLCLDGKCIVGVATGADMEAYGVLPKHLDGIVNQLRVTKGVEVAVFLYETGDGGFKASLRSNGKVDVSKVAMAFGGGGHVMAAGASLEGSLEDVARRLLEEIAKQL